MSALQDALAAFNAGIAAARAAYYADQEPDTVRCKRGHRRIQGRTCLPCHAATQRRAREAAK